MASLDLSIFSLLFSKFIDPIVTLILNISGIALFLLLCCVIYTIFKLRINPFHVTKYSVLRLKRMKIKLKIFSFIRWVVCDIIYFKKFRDIFREFGFTIYCGFQGAGKSIGMIEYANRIHFRYPECIIVSNFKYIYADKIMTDWHDLLNISNGKKGVLFLIDEIHSEYSNKEWDNFPEELLSQISQQRKQRIKICATSQVYTRVVKQIREQTHSVIQCRTFFNRWTFWREYNAKSYEAHCDNLTKKKLKTIRKGSFVQSDFLRRCYDTYEKIERMKKMEFLPRNRRTA